MKRKHQRKCRTCVSWSEGACWLRVIRSRGSNVGRVCHNDRTPLSESDKKMLRGMDPMKKINEWEKARRGKA